MRLEFHQLDRGYEHPRVHRPERQRRLLVSLAASGQQTPIVVVAICGQRDRYRVIDGYKRVAALEQLGRDTVEAVVWPMGEAEALLLDRSMRFSESETALEQGWLHAELEERFGYSLDELARRFDRSVSWVSRRLALVEVLPAAVQQLYPINPKALARYREAFHCSGAKGDVSDAALLMDFLRCHRDQLKAWLPDDEATRTIQLLVEHRRKTVNDRTRLVNRLTRLLKEYFPQALGWAGELSSRQAGDFLLKWPTLEAVQKARPAQIRAFYHRYNGRSAQRIEERLVQIRQAVPLTRGQAIITASMTMVQSVVRQIQCLSQAVTQFDQQLETLFRQHPDHAIYESFPGAGAVLAPRLLSAMGSRRDRYASAVEVQQFSGIAPVTVSSGKRRWVHRRWACPKFVLQSFHEFAKESVPWSAWARAYYQGQRERGVEHNAAVRALAFKWIRILYRCWQDRTTYDEQHYIQVLRRRGSPLVARLDPAP